MSTFCMKLNNYKQYFSDVIKTNNGIYEGCEEQKDLVEDYPVAWNKEEFDAITSYAGKMKYASTHLAKIASGSGRVVYKIDETKVLKLAKNKKGVAQNEIESDRYLQKYGIVAKIFDVDTNNNYWLEMELAKKVSPKRFKELSGGFSLDEVGIYTKINKEDVKWMKLDPVVREKMDNSEFITDLMSVVYDFDMQVGDLNRASTWGEVLRNGSPTVVLIDYGLTTGVWNDFYKVN